MNWDIQLSSKAVKYYKRLPGKIQKEVRSELFKLKTLDAVLSHPEVKPLLGKLKGFYRLRVGKYRVIFGLLKQEGIIAVVNIRPRGDVY
ncbi:MAG: type II toxin-antitoxin system RelE/ParE family toxin [Candidatus Ratteibacteria bacterium]|jgi:mRNA interferase RelE/StbE